MAFQEIDFAPGDWIGPMHAETANKAAYADREYWAFDKFAVESMISRPFKMPQQPNGYSGNALVLDIFYSTDSLNSGGFKIEAVVEAVTPNSDTTPTMHDTAGGYDTSVNAFTQTVPGTAGALGMYSLTLTNRDSVAAGDMCRLKLTRKGQDTGDNLAGDIKIYLCSLYEENA